MKRELTAAEQRLRSMLLRHDATDEFAECLMAHSDCCELRGEALSVLELVGISEVEYLEAWALGLYSG